MTNLIITTPSAYPGTYEFSSTELAARQLACNRVNVAIDTAHNMGVEDLAAPEYYDSTFAHLDAFIKKSSISQLYDHGMGQQELNSPRGHVQHKQRLVAKELQCPTITTPDGKYSVIDLSGRKFRPTVHEISVRRTDTVSEIRTLMTKPRAKTKLQKHQRFLDATTYPLLTTYFGRYSALCMLEYDKAKCLELVELIRAGNVSTAAKLAAYVLSSIH